VRRVKPGEPARLGGVRLAWRRANRSHTISVRGAPLTTPNTGQPTLNPEISTCVVSPLFPAGVWARPGRTLGAPRGLLSALQFHEIGIQLPADVWIAVERGTRSPANPPVPLRIVRFSGTAFTQGIEEHRVEGVTIRVYSVAKTLADLFKYRGELGVGIAIEALREAWDERRFDMEALTRAAHACRMERVMRPYVEAVVA